VQFEHRTEGHVYHLYAKSADSIWLQEWLAKEDAALIAARAGIFAELAGRLHGKRFAAGARFAGVTYLLIGPPA
jgi:hypothetical protein